MPQTESPLDKFNKFVDITVAKRLKDLCDQMVNIKDQGNIADVRELVSEANSLVSFSCREDDELYEKWRFRVFLESRTGSIIILQGMEIDVDFRDWVESDTGNAEDEDGEDTNDEDYPGSEDF